MMNAIIRFTALAILLPKLIAPVLFAQNNVETIAGGGPNNLPALKSSMGYPTGVAVDGTGNLYVANAYYGRVFKVDTTGNVTVVAGNGAWGSVSVGDGSPAVGVRLEYPSGVAVDGSGNIFIADRSDCRIREVSAQTGIISTVAGAGTCYYFGDGGPATSAWLDDPSGVAVDKHGNIFIADTLNCLVREVSAQTGNISILAGTPPDQTGLLHCGYSGDGGLATNAKVWFPNDVAVDGSGNVFIADTSSCAIREVSTSTGIISTVAGSGSCGYSGDGALATSAQINLPNGVTIDSSGNIFIADTSNCLIREVFSSSGNISTVAGDYSLGCGYSGDGAPATSGTLNEPYGVAVDKSGNVLIADYENSVIREVSAHAGNISTFAGVAIADPEQAGQLIAFPAYSGDGYLGTDGEIGFLNDSPWSAGLATDHFGNVFIADTANDVVREVSASTGIITTVAGNGLVGYSGDGGPATSAEFWDPRDVAVDGAGNVFIVDSGNCIIRKVSASTGIISTVAGTPPDSFGNYYCGYAGDGGPATSAQIYPIDLLSAAGGVALNSSGNIFIADTGNGVIREVSGSTGIITTVAGVANSLDHGTGDGGPATSATFFAPYGVTVDNSGNIFVADNYDYAVREVMAVNGNIYTIAGNMALGQGFSGDGGPADLAQVRNTFGLFLDPAGNLFIPDSANCVVREVSSSTGFISTAAGTPNPMGTYFCGYAGDGGPALSAVFDNPGAAGADASGDLVVLDNIRVRSVAGLVQASGAGAVAFPSTLTFPSTLAGTSDTLAAILSNRGSSQTTVSSVAISGTNASDFSETDNCRSQPLAAGGGSCAINVKFTPSTTGTEIALLTMTDTAGTQTVNLSGLSGALTLSTNSLTFAADPLGTRSASQQVTVTNPGTSPVTVPAITVSGTNAVDFSEGDNCAGLTLQGGGSCTINVVFDASVTAAESAQLSVGGLLVSLSGAGIDFSVAAATGGSLSATVTQGQTASYSLQVTAIGGASPSDQVSVSMACAGLPSEAFCSSTPQPVVATVATPGALTVSVNTTAPSQGMALPPINGIKPPVRPGLLAIGIASLWALSLFVWMRGARAARPRLAWLAAQASIVLATVLMVGCGGSSSQSSPPTGGTPTGTYTLTLTGTAGNDRHSIQLTLVVNAD
ncbi:MAG: choice-of-anchor D domain-containing protein [Terriglobales bacterium]